MAPPLSPHPGSQEGLRNSPGCLHCPRPCCPSLCSPQCEQPPWAQGVQHLALRHRARPDAAEETAVPVLQPLSQGREDKTGFRSTCPCVREGISVEMSPGGALTELYSSPLRSMQRNHLLLKSKSSTVSLRVDLAGKTTATEERER